MSSTDSRCAGEEWCHLLARFWHDTGCPCLEGMGGSFCRTEFKTAYCLPSGNGSSPLCGQRAGFWSHGLLWCMLPMCKEWNDLLSINEDFSCLSDLHKNPSMPPSMAATVIFFFIPCSTKSKWHVFRFYANKVLRLVLLIFKCTKPTDFYCPVFICRSPNPCL